METENFQKSDSTETVTGKALEIEADALQSQLEFHLKKNSLPKKSDVCSVSNVKIQGLEEKDIPSPIQTHEFLGEEVDDGRSLNKHKLAPKSQATLLLLC